MTCGATTCRWSPMNGITLHPLQVRITLQAARLLHVGGLMVYSTCSFNPIENEAVVAEVLRRSKVKGQGDQGPVAADGRGA